MARATRFATPTRSAPFVAPPVKGGEIVPYIPIGQKPPAPTRLVTEPYNPARPTTQKAPAKSPAGEIIEGEFTVTPNPRRPVTQSDGNASSESRHPQSHPNYPDPAAGWKSHADFAAWQNGASREKIDSERAAYEFTKEWGKSGGVLYPFTENGPRTPIISDNYDKANNYRKRNGLPAIDRYGHEMPMAWNPSRAPASDYTSNPFKLPKPDPSPDQGTPSNFDADPYNFETDPDTGKPFTQTQKDGAREYGRPEWHIDPSTGMPWGSDEPGAPIPLPFNGYPGGALNYGLPRIPDYDTGLGLWSFGVTYSRNDGGPSEFPPIQRTFELPGDGPPYFQADERQWHLYSKGKRVYDNWIRTTYTPTLTNPVFTPYAPAPGQPGSQPTFSPIGNPSLPARPEPAPRPAPGPRPEPTQDPRVNPSPVPNLPYAPNKKPIDHPNTPNPLPNPGPGPIFRPFPRIPSQPDYAPNPAPYPRNSPNGQPQNAPNPSNQPEPARPSNPKPFTQTDRPKNPTPQNPSPNDPPVRCPDPCPKPESILISYKRFKGCLFDFDGNPDRFSLHTMDVPKDSGVAIKTMLDALADVRALECKPCCYWKIKPGRKRLVFSGIPPLPGLNVPLGEGCNEIMIEFNAQNAYDDKGLRNMRRSTNPITTETTFINTAIAYIANPAGEVIHAQELWVPKWVFTIPIGYKDIPMSVRIMSKGVSVNFKIWDTGGKWSEVTE